MTMRGLWKAHHAIQTAEARADWQRIAEQAEKMGLAAQARDLAPTATAGWRTIDKRIAKLRAIMEKAK